MSDIIITVEHNEYRLAGTLAFMNLGTGVARVRIYGNERRVAPTDAAGAAPLVTLDLLDPAGAVADNMLTLAPGADVLVLTSGFATWAEVINGNGNTVFDSDVSIPSGTATVRLPDLTLYAGGLTRLVSGILV